MRKWIASLGVIFLAVSCQTEKPNTTEKVEEVVEVKQATEVAVNLSNSTVKWKGKAPGEEHFGTISLQGGSFKVLEDKLQAGSSFIIDIHTIVVEDLAEDKGKSKLEAHLKGTTEEAEKQDHFFNVKTYPTASFVVSNVNGDTVEGNLTIKGKEKGVSFKATFQKVGEGYEFKTSEPIKINRVDFGINFMSKSVFDDLKDKFIDDIIEIEFEVKS